MIKVNSEYSEVVRFSYNQVKQFAELTGDKNPLHIDADYAEKNQFKKCIVHGLYAASVFPKIMANTFPGPGTVYLDQAFDFKKPVYQDVDYKAVLRVISERKTSAGKMIYKLITQLLDSNNSVLIDGEATILV